MVRKGISIFLFILAFNFTEAQDIRKLQETFFEAEYFLLYEEYQDALIYYQQIYEQMPDNANIAYRIGLCYLNIPEKKNLAVSFLEIAAANTSATYREGALNQKTAPYESIYYLGEAYRISYQFDKARESFIKYRETLLSDDTENIDFVDHQIEICTYAKELRANPVDFSAENIGNLFNDEKDNYNPVISDDGNTFAFMVSLKFYNAIMISRKVNGEWTPPLNITPELELDGTLFISCLSADGNTLLMSRNDNFESNIFVSHYDGQRWSTATMLNKNINTKHWESHGYISEDGTYLIFASDRPGGYGGLDLYISKKENGDWGQAVNMGPEVNTPFNEDRPFLTNKGETLFFCSQGHYNMGGYDLFRSDRNPNALWSKPENMGYPINTPDDDTFFMPVNNGEAGFIAWFRSSLKSFGQRDIYKITIR